MSVTLESLLALLFINNLEGDSYSAKAFEWAINYFLFEIFYPIFPYVIVELVALEILLLAKADVLSFLKASYAFIFVDPASYFDFKKSNFGILVSLLESSDSKGSSLISSSISGSIVLSLAIGLRYLYGLEGWVG